MNDRIRKAFEECDKFIDEHTSKELEEYEKSLNLDYGRKFTEEENDLYNEMLEKLSTEICSNVLALFEDD